MPIWHIADIEETYVNRRRFKWTLEHDNLLRKGIEIYSHNVEEFSLQDPCWLFVLLPIRYLSTYLVEAPGINVKEEMKAVLLKERFDNCNLDS